MGTPGDKRIIVRGGRVYRHDGDTDDPSVADILIDNDRIAQIGPGIDPKGADIVDAAGCLVLPGFVNSHYHSHDVLMKGCFETIPLEAWLLNALPPSYPKRSVEEVRARTLLGAVECLHTGVTTIQDMLTIFPFDEDHIDAVFRAYEDIGIRVVFSLQIGNIPGLDRVPFWRETVPEDLHKYLGASVEPYGQADPMEIVAAQHARMREAHPAIGWALGPTSPEFCTPDLLERIADYSARENLPVLTHIYESRSMALSGRHFIKEHGGSQVRLLGSVGLLGPRLSLAHAVWMVPEEIEMLAESGTNVVLNPVGNMKTKSGVAPIRGYLDAGVHVGLGCDNCSCSDVQNMFQAMKLYAMLAAVSDPAPGPPTAAESIQAATVNGAKILGLQDDIGAIEVGKKADLSILDLTRPSFVPLNSAARQVVFSENGAAVKTVLVDGRVVFQDGRTATISESELRDAVDVVMVTARPDIADVAKRVAELYPYVIEAWKRGWDEDIGTNRYIGTHRA